MSLKLDKDIALGRKSAGKSKGKGKSRKAPVASTGGAAGVPSLAAPGAATSGLRGYLAPFNTKTAKMTAALVAGALGAGVIGPRVDKALDNIPLLNKIPVGVTLGAATLAASQIPAIKGKEVGKLAAIAGLGMALPDLIDSSRALVDRATNMVSPAPAAPAAQGLVAIGSIFKRDEDKQAERLAAKIEKARAKGKVGKADKLLARATKKGLRDEVMEDLDDDDGDGIKDEDERPRGPTIRAYDDSDMFDDGPTIVRRPAVVVAPRRVVAPRIRRPVLVRRRR